jgi:hypothetical protein
VMLTMFESHNKKARTDRASFIEKGRGC